MWHIWKIKFNGSIQEDRTSHKPGGSDQPRSNYFHTLIDSDHLVVVRWIVGNWPPPPNYNEYIIAIKE